MAITPSLPSTQPGSPSITRRVATPRFAGGPGPSDAGTNTPAQEDIFTPSQTAEEREQKALDTSAAGMSQIDDLLAFLDASKDIDGSNPFHALHQTRMRFDEENPYTAPIADQTSILQKMDERDAALRATWGSWAPLAKHFQPTPLDGENRETKLALQALKESGVSMEDHFKEQNAAIRKKHQDEFATIQERIKDEMRAKLREQGINDEQEIEARIKQAFEDAQPDIDATFRAEGLDATDIEQIRQKTQKPEE